LTPPGAVEGISDSETTIDDIREQVDNSKNATTARRTAACVSGGQEEEERGRRSEGKTGQSSFAESGLGVDEVACDLVDGALAVFPKLGRTASSVTPKERPGSAICDSETCLEIVHYHPSMVEEIRKVSPTIRAARASVTAILLTQISFFTQNRADYYSPATRWAKQLGLSPDVVLHMIGPRQGRLVRKGLVSSNRKRVPGKRRGIRQMHVSLTKKGKEWISKHRKTEHLRYFPLMAQALAERASSLGDPHQAASPAHWAVVLALLGSLQEQRNAWDVSQAEIAEDVGHSPTAVGATIRRLLAHGWLRREKERDPLILSADGLALYERCRLRRLPAGLKPESLLTCLRSELLQHWGEQAAALVPNKLVLAQKIKIIDQYMCPYPDTWHLHVRVLVSEWSQIRQEYPYPKGEVPTFDDLFARGIDEPLASRVRRRLSEPVNDSSGGWADPWKGSSGGCQV
tara:strand:- start:4021 stop:5397 length:1377 start_codon:yes stop_codon:yes gene_type:complete